MAASLRSFYTLIATQIVSLIGSRITGVAIGALIIVTTLLVYPFVRHLEAALPDYAVVPEQPTFAHRKPISPCK